MSTPPWLSRLLEAREITDICLNGPDEVFIDRGKGIEPARLSGEGERPGFDSLEDMRAWVLDQLSLAGKTWDARYPFVDAALPSQHRLHVAFPPLARPGILVSLRRLASAENGPPRWAGSRWFGQLKAAVEAGESILISGATGSGKTTLVSDLLACVSSRERIVALEDTPELRPAHPHFVTLVSRPPNADGCGEVTLRALLRQALRMRPDRIVLGECRGGEVLDLLQVLNTGHAGAMATIHANSPRDALRRIELLCLLAGAGSVPVGAIRELLSVGIRWVAQVRRTADSREISELCHVEGREGDTILLRPMVSMEND